MHLVDSILCFKVYSIYSSLFYKLLNYHLTLKHQPRSIRYTVSYPGIKVSWYQTINILRKRREYLWEPAIGNEINSGS